MSARAIAFQVLLQVERADAFLNVALDAALRSSPGLSSADAGLATELAYGIARRALTLDAVLAAHSARPLRKLETAVHVALRLGAYQLIFLDRIPEHAAVGETVELVKDQGLGRASGFVNAILRKIAVDRRIPLPEDPTERLSIQESHPRWLVERWTRRFGAEETAALCQANNHAPPVCVRTNTTRATRDEVIEKLAAAGVKATPTPLSPLGLWLETPGPLAQLEPFRQGLFQVQDEAAQVVSMLAHATPGMRVLDACAAPGGKACHLAEQLAGEGELHAVDLYARKLERLKEEARRLGLAQTIRVRAADALKPLPFEERSFDLAVLDAPCSGLGTLRRHPELRYRRTEQDIGRLAQMQGELIDNVLRYLKPGGHLLFAVCSMEPEEGEQQVARLLGKGLTISEPEIAGFPWDRVRAPGGGIATFPHRHQADGFFAARFTLP